MHTIFMIIKINFPVLFLNIKTQTYEYLQITVKPSDKKFILHGIDGHIL